MAEQIAVKLNEARFKPLIDNIRIMGGHIAQSNSEVVGKSIFLHILL
jgi:hypothetical protein